MKLATLVVRHGGPLAEANSFRRIRRRALDLVVSFAVPRRCLRPRPDRRHTWAEKLLAGFPRSHDARWRGVMAAQPRRASIPPTSRASSYLVPRPTEEPEAT